MSIQSTINITRKEAYEKYAEMKMEKLRKTFIAEAMLMDDSEVEDAIEEDFYNYCIIELENDPYSY